MFSKVMFLLIITIFGVSILQDWKVFLSAQFKGHICYSYRLTEFISRMKAFNASNYFSHSLMCRYLAEMNIFNSNSFNRLQLVKWAIL